MKNNAQFISEVLSNDLLNITQKTLVLYLVNCETKKDTIDEIADDFCLLPTELFRELQNLEKRGYIKIKIEAATEK